MIQISGIIPSSNLEMTHNLEWQWFHDVFVLFNKCSPIFLIKRRSYLAWLIASKEIIVHWTLFTRWNVVSSSTDYAQINWFEIWECCHVHMFSPLNFFLFLIRCFKGILIKFLEYFLYKKLTNAVHIPVRVKKTQVRSK